MRKLSKPSDLPGVVFMLCVSSVRDKLLKARFTRVKSDIEAAAAKYEMAATTTALHTLPVEKDVAGVVTKDEMESLYKGRMVKGQGRVIYDKLMMLPANGICPLCGHRTVSTLDHHLPKAMFPSLAVTPINLVPACGDCNKAKLEERPATPQEQTFHPYFDDFGRDRWLHADVVQDSPPTVRFFVQPPANWPPLWGARAQHHFATLKLGVLYASQAGQELANIRHHLMTLSVLGGTAAVQKHLTEQAISRELANPNSWQTAMYRALSTSAWFCADGFAKIPQAGS